jgi:PAS domain S-box-containing protein
MQEGDDTKMRETPQEQIDSSQRKFLTVLLTLTMLCMLIGMTVYEFLKHIISPDITIWQSHIITIIFSSSIATVIAYFVLRMRQLLLHRLTYEISRHKQMQEELMTYRNHLEELVEERTHELNEVIEQLQQENTERKQAEERIKFLAEVLNSSPLSVIATDKGEKIIYINPATERLFGYTSDALLGKNPIILNADPNANKIQRDIFDTIGQGRVWRGEILNKKKNGEVFPLYASVYQLLDEEGNFIAIVGFQEDITERKQAEKALRESEQRFKQMAENIHEIFWLTDPKSARMLYASPAYEDVWQAPVEDLYENPRQWMKFIHRDDRAIVIANQEKQARGQVTYEEFRIVRPDGSVRWIANRAYPIRDEMGEFYRMTGVAEDITERKRVEESLRESEIRYRELADSITDVFFAFDRDLRYTYWNKASENLTGIPAQDALGKSLYELFPDTSQTRKAARVYLDVLRTQQPQTFVNEYQLEGKDFVFEINAYPSRDGISVFTKDITERKKAEEQLKRSLREKEVLLQELYHRTRNNMNVIAAMLSMQVEDVGDQRLTRTIEEIKQRILSMAMVHEQLYESQDLSHVNLRSYTQQLADSLLANYHVGSGKIALKLEIEPIVVLIETAIPYGLMVNELMTNALKYAFPEGRDGEIRIALRRLPEEEKELELRFCDNGIGMPEDLDIRKTESFGMKLITLLAEMQLRGIVDLQINNGTEFHIQFQELNYKARV